MTHIDASLYETNWSQAQLWSLLLGNFGYFFGDRDVTCECTLHFAGDTKVEVIEAWRLLLGKACQTFQGYGLTEKWGAEHTFVQINGDRERFRVVTNQETTLRINVSQRFGVLVALAYFDDELAGEAILTYEERPVGDYTTFIVALDGDPENCRTIYMHIKERS